MLVPACILVAPLLTLPQESEGKEQHDETNRTDRVEHVGNADLGDPGRHGEDKDGAKCVPRKCEGHQCITDNLDPWNIVSAIPSL